LSLPPIELGQRHGPFPGTLDPVVIARYADATNDPNPRYRDGTAVPVAFPAILVFDAQTAGNSAVPREAIRAARAAVHGEHDLVMHRPLVPGEDLAIWSEASTVRITKAGTRIVLRIEMRDAADQVVAEQWWTTFFAGAEIGVDAGPELLDHTFPESARAEPAGRYTVHVDADQPTRYAEVSGDWSAHHFDRDVARREGFADVFLHGLCTMAMCGQAVVETVAGGDPTRVRRLAVRFASPTMLDHDLDVELFHAGPNAVAFEATCAGATVIKHGRAELRDASP
jgi:acyl dehydratase